MVGGGFRVAMEIAIKIWKGRGLGGSEHDVTGDTDIEVSISPAADRACVMGKRDEENHAM
jgi:hypothetical protein